jgi:periplasmic protein TonB
MLVKPAIFLFGILAAPSLVIAADTGPVPAEVTASQTCQEHIVHEPRMTAADFPSAARGREYEAYVVISYKLDGSGKAVEPKVVDSKPKRLFDKTTLSLLDRTEFALGEIKESCTYVRTYSAVRRSGR